MAYDKRCDCANSGSWVPDARIGTDGTATCGRCKQSIPTSHAAGPDGGGYLFIHLRPGKTLADRR